MKQRLYEVTYLAELGPDGLEPVDKFRFRAPDINEANRVANVCSATDMNLGGIGIKGFSLTEVKGA